MVTCKKCGKWVDTLSKRRHRCRKKKSDDPNPAPVLMTQTIFNRFGNVTFDYANRGKSK